MTLIHLQECRKISIGNILLQVTLHELSLLPVISGLKVGRTHSFRHMASRTKVYDLDPIWLSGWVYQHDVLWFEISMNQSQAFQLH